MSWSGRKTIRRATGSGRGNQLLDHGDKLREIERFGQERSPRLAQKNHRLRIGGISGDKNDALPVLREVLTQKSIKLPPVELPHEHIGEDDVELVANQHGQRLAPGFGGHYIEPRGA